MNTCIKTVVNINCHYCFGAIIKFGKIGNQQRYRCKSCNKTQIAHYSNKAYKPHTNSYIINYVTEGCGIRSIARLLNISPNTVIRRIKLIASNIKKPPIITNKVYEVDELKTYIKKKSRECWVTYALDQQTGQVVDLKVGSRNQASLKRVIDTLLLSNCKRIYTDGWRVYRQIIPSKIHKIKRFGANRIERRNLTLRTHLKRLNRKTICFSKSIVMLEACLKIYFWYKPMAA
ncbi:MAG: IS1 family transposase [Bacteroidota bacterium]